jgi:hypothetical protein
MILAPAGTWIEQIKIGDSLQSLYVIMRSPLRAELAEKKEG